ncbi:MAG: VIT1/CCC1 transporter family protein [Candidatus Kerfeldbacteria bacterium]|nr:VIT1/CCC1 transporter family protein [Candidatus Kerfeldbacteria bacterium]
MLKHTPTIPQYKIEEIRQIHHQGKSQEDFHQIVAGAYIGDVVYGANDGIITTFAVVAGVAGAALSPTIVLILGVANILADGFSMAAGNFLARKSEHEYRRTERGREEWEIDHLPEEERQEIRELYAAKGFVGADLERAVSIITSNRKVWVDEMMAGELKIVGEGEGHPLKNALATLIAFVLAGAVPLVPYVAGFSGLAAFGWAAVAAAVVLFAVGSLRTLVTGKRWWLAGLEMLVVGVVAAVVAYLVGYFLSKLV